MFRKKNTSGRIILLLEGIIINRFTLHLITNMLSGILLLFTTYSHYLVHYYYRRIIFISLALFFFIPQIWKLLSFLNDKQTLLGPFLFYQWTVSRKNIGGKKRDVFRKHLLFNPVLRNVVNVVVHNVVGFAAKFLMCLTILRQFEVKG